jgi:protein-disulfide isomerase
MRYVKQLRSVSFVPLVVWLLAAACQGGGSMNPSAPLTPTVPTITTLPPLDEMLSDKTMGSASAPNTLLEYVSFWCTSCATFEADVLPQLKSKYVDTGSMQIKFYNLILGVETTNAVNLARCAGNARFFDAANLIFTRQSTWLNASDPDSAVNQLMVGFGMSQQVVNTCVADTDLSNGIIGIHTAALAQWGMTAVPAVVINGTLLQGADASVANIEKYLVQ